MQPRCLVLLHPLNPKPSRTLPSRVAPMSLSLPPHTPIPWERGELATPTGDRTAVPLLLRCIATSLTTDPRVFFLVFGLLSHAVALICFSLVHPMFWGGVMTIYICYPIVSLVRLRRHRNKVHSIRCRLLRALTKQYSLQVRRLDDSIQSGHGHAHTPRALRLPSFRRHAHPPDGSSPLGLQLLFLFFCLAQPCWLLATSEPPNITTSRPSLLTLPMPSTPTAPGANNSLMYVALSITLAMGWALNLPNTNQLQPRPCHRFTYTQRPGRRPFRVHITGPGRRWYRHPFQPRPYLQRLRLPHTRPLPSALTLLIALSILPLVASTTPGSLPPLPAIPVPAIGVAAVAAFANNPLGRHVPLLPTATRGRRRRRGRRPRRTPATLADQVSPWVGDHVMSAPAHTLRGRRAVNPFSHQFRCYSKNLAGLSLTNPANLEGILQALHEAKIDAAFLVHVTGTKSAPLTPVEANSVSLAVAQWQPDNASAKDPPPYAAALSYDQSDVQHEANGTVIVYRSGFATKRVTASNTGHWLHLELAAWGKKSVHLIAAYSPDGRYKDLHPRERMVRDDINLSLGQRSSNLPLPQSQRSPALSAYSQGPVIIGGDFNSTMGPNQRENHTGDSCPLDGVGSLGHTLRACGAISILPNRISRAIYSFRTKRGQYGALIDHITVHSKAAYKSLVLQAALDQAGEVIAASDHKGILAVLDFTRLFQATRQQYEDAPPSSPQSSGHPTPSPEELHLTQQALAEDPSWEPLLQAATAALEAPASLHRIQDLNQCLTELATHTPRWQPAAQAAHEALSATTPVERIRHLLNTQHRIISISLARARDKALALRGPAAKRRNARAAGHNRETGALRQARHIRRKLFGSTASVQHILDLGPQDQHRRLNTIITALRSSWKAATRATRDYPTSLPPCPTPYLSNNQEALVAWLPNAKESLDTLISDILSRISSRQQRATTRSQERCLRTWAKGGKGIPTQIFKDRLERVDDSWAEIPNPDFVDTDPPGPHNCPTLITRATSALQHYARELYHDWFHHVKCPTDCICCMHENARTPCTPRQTNSQPWVTFFQDTDGRRGARVVDSSEDLTADATATWRNAKPLPLTPSEASWAAHIMDPITPKELDDALRVSAQKRSRCGSSGVSSLLLNQSPDSMRAGLLALLNTTLRTQVIASDFHTDLLQPLRKQAGRPSLPDSRPILSDFSAIKATATIKAIKIRTMMNHMLQVALLGLLLLVGCSAFSHTNVHNEPDAGGSCQDEADAAYAAYEENESAEDAADEAWDAEKDADGAADEAKAAAYAAADKCCKDLGAAVAGCEIE